jgi:hypothetical protein
MVVGGADADTRKMASSIQVIVLAVVAPVEELSLACMTSLLRLQQLAARRNDVRLDVHMVPTFLDALNAYVAGEFVVVLDANIGAPPEFVFGILDSKHNVIAGVYPVPGVDWDRVRKIADDPLANEPLNHAGNVYNVIPASAGFQRYIPIAEIKELRALAVRSSVLEKLAGPDISYAAEDGTTKYLFTHDSVFENKLQNVWQTFARKTGEVIVADIETPCVYNAPAQFAGCVGMRTSLR